jgi:transcriptional regulator with XRE-family HTH domain
MSRLQEHPIQLRNRIAEERRINGLTAAELAERAGIGLRTLSLLENDRRTNPSLAVVLSLAKVLGKPIEYLFFADDEGLLPCGHKIEDNLHIHSGSKPSLVLHAPVTGADGPIAPALVWCVSDGWVKLTPEEYADLRFGTS